MHENYLSQQDIDICLGFDVEGLVDQPEFEGIRALHEALISEYGPDDDRGALYQPVAADGAARRR